MFSKWWSWTRSRWLNVAHVLEFHSAAVDCVCGGTINGPWVVWAHPGTEICFHYRNHRGLYTTHHVLLLKESIVCVRDKVRYCVLICGVKNIENNRVEITIWVEVSCLERAPAYTDDELTMMRLVYIDVTLQVKCRLVWTSHAIHSGNQSSSCVIGHRPRDVLHNEADFEAAIYGKCRCCM